MATDTANARAIAPHLLRGIFRAAVLGSPFTLRLDVPMESKEYKRVLGILAIIVRLRPSGGGIRTDLSVEERINVQQVR
jgi:hypothetical protein